ncbi:unnamed protein product [Rotaria socialis]|uniref:Uncharacterized protein n=2 Tax=Rotaria socialis TaxID=392032 RepID=A0A821LXI6_9BILA|nr:unnamed protein product [Rotaria socialis]
MNELEIEIDSNSDREYATVQKAEPTNLDEELDTNGIKCFRVTREDYRGIDIDPIIEVIAQQVHDECKTKEEKREVRDRYKKLKPLWLKAKIFKEHIGHGEKTSVAAILRGIIKQRGKEDDDCGHIIGASVGVDESLRHYQDKVPNSDLSNFPGYGCYFGKIGYNALVYGCIWLNACIAFERGLIVCLDSKTNATRWRSICTITVFSVIATGSAIPMMVYNCDFGNIPGLQTARLFLVWFSIVTGLSIYVLATLLILISFARRIRQYGTEDGSFIKTYLKLFYNHLFIFIPPIAYAVGYISYTVIINTGPSTQYYFECGISMIEFIVKVLIESLQGVPPVLTWLLFIYSSKYLVNNWLAFFPFTIGLVGWLRLLPNIKCLTCDLTELRYWFINDLHNQYFDTFLQRLDRLYVNCSCIITREMNEELLTSLLQFLIDEDRLPQLQFICCKNILSAWTNIDQLIDFILSRMVEHQLTCMCFDFEQQKQLSTDLRTTDETIRITEPPCVVYIHRFISSNRVSLWIERQRK